MIIKTKNKAKRAFFLGGGQNNKRKTGSHISFMVKDAPVFNINPQFCSAVFIVFEQSLSAKARCPDVKTGSAFVTNAL